MLFDYIYVEKREDEYSPYMNCVVSQIRDPYFHHLSIVGNNQKKEERVSSIDINAITIKNLDPKVYNDQAEL